MKKRIEAEVAGLKVVLFTEESEEYIGSLAKELENKARSFMFSGAGAVLDKALLMCALDSLDNEKKLRKENEALRRRLEEKGEN